MADANPRLKRILEKVGAKTFFEDLAEYGYLRQYINQFMEEEYNNDDKFKLKMFKIFYKYSKYPDKDLNDYYLSHLNNAMKSFTEEIDNA